MATPDPDEDTSSPTGETLAQGASFAPKAGPDQTGDLAKMPLDEMVTDLFCARATGTLTVEAHGGEPAGELVFWKGDVLAASAGKLSGDDAVIALLRRKSGAFRFTEDLEPREQNVKRSVPELVEAARGRGEKRRGAR